MKYFEQKQIHASCSSWSSRDGSVVREITRDEFTAHPDPHKLVSRKRGFSIAHAKADEQFYNLPFSQSATEKELKQHIAERYLSQGWVNADDHPFLKTAISLWCEDDRIATKARRAKQGYVIPEWSRDIPADDYQGGFSDDIFRHPALYDYVKSGGCHGFIGHSVRKPKLDAYFESQFLKAEPDKALLAMWLTSTGGRHFCDPLEGCSFREQQAYIRKDIARVIAEAKRYDADNRKAACVQA